MYPASLISSSALKYTHQHLKMSFFYDSCFSTHTCWKYFLTGWIHTGRFSMLSVQPGVLPGWPAMWPARLLAVRNNLRGDECFNTSQSEWTSPPVIVIWGFSAGSTETGRNPAARMCGEGGVWEHHRAAEMSVRSAGQHINSSPSSFFIEKFSPNFWARWKRWSLLCMCLRAVWSWSQQVGQFCLAWAPEARANGSSRLATTFTCIFVYRCLPRKVWSARVTTE